MPGPLPNPQKRRRNAPTIPATTLPAAGRPGRPPKPPVELGTAGKSWWKWAWSTPQATQWDKGSMYTIARRASLEDDMAALDELGGFSLDDYMDVSADEQHLARCLESAVQALKRLAGNRVTVAKECRELEKRLGLDPKALADLRWTISDSAGDEQEDKGAKGRDNVRVLRPTK